MCESRIFVGGYLQFCQDTRINLFITRSPGTKLRKCQDLLLLSLVRAFLWFDANMAAGAAGRPKLLMLRRSRIQTGCAGDRGGGGDLVEALTSGGVEEKWPDFGRWQKVDHGGRHCSSRAVVLRRPVGSIERRMR
jgi:hypothetical protein